MIQETNYLSANIVVAYARTVQQRHRKKVRKPKMIFRLKNGRIHRTRTGIGTETDGNALPHRTFIMRWNPDISNFKITDFEACMDSFRDDDFYFDWSVWDHEKVKVGDRFFMVKVGSGRCGVVMEGTISSLPWKDEDWSGRGRDVRYVRLSLRCMVHPIDSDTMLTTEELAAAIPTFCWNEGHSGEVLNNIQALQMDALWNSHLQKICEM